MSLPVILPGQYDAVGGILETLVQSCQDGAASLQQQCDSESFRYIQELQARVEQLLRCANLDEIVKLGVDGPCLSQRDLNYLCSPLLDRMFIHPVMPASESVAALTSAEECSSGSLFSPPRSRDAIIEICHKAAKSSGGLTTLQFLVSRGLDVNDTCSTDIVPSPETTLCVACHHNQLQIAEFLLESGARPNSTALEAAVRHPDGQIVLLLCRLGVQVNVLLPKSRLSPVGLAANLMHLEVTHVLIAHGADVNGANGEPLYHACLNDDVPTVRLLFSTAKLKLDLFDVPSLRIVVSRGHMRVISCIEELAPHHRWFHTAHDGVSILQAALRSHRVDMLDFWLQRGCRASAEHSQALRTALVGFCPHKFEMVERLLQHGANPLDPTGLSARTILQQAADAGVDFRIICLMLRHVTVVTDQQFIQLCQISSFSAFHHVVDIMQHRLDPQLPLLHQGLVGACSRAAAFRNAAYLLSLGADITWQNNAPLTSLAASDGSFLKLDWLLRGQRGKIHHLSPDAVHLLYAAALRPNGNTDLVLALHANGAVVPSKLDELLAMTAVVDKDGIATLLLSWGASAGCPEAVYASLRQRSGRVLHGLLETGLCESARSAEAVRIACAAWRTHPALLRMLLEHGADVRVIHADCLDANRSLTVSAFPVDLVKLLLRYGLDLSANPGIRQACMPSGCLLTSSAAGP